MLKNLGARFSATTLAKNLSIAEQQQVEIGRALIHEGRILIMDEPTAALSDRETEQLFKIIEQLRDKGIAILYISHRMAEVHRLAHARDDLARRRLRRRTHARRNSNRGASCR